MTYTWEEAVELAIQKYPKARRIAVENATMGQEDSMIFRINLERDCASYGWSAQTMNAIRFIMNNTAARWGKEKKEKEKV